MAAKMNAELERSRASTGGSAAAAAAASTSAPTQAGSGVALVDEGVRGRKKPSDGDDEETMVFSRRSTQRVPIPVVELDSDDADLPVSSQGSSPARVGPNKDEDPRVLAKGAPADRVLGLSKHLVRYVHQGVMEQRRLDRFDAYLSCSASASQVNSLANLHLHPQERFELNFSRFSADHVDPWLAHDEVFSEHVEFNMDTPDTSFKFKFYAPFRSIRSALSVKLLYCLRQGIWPFEPPRACARSGS
jgi:hypothetical protein